MGCELHFGASDVDFGASDVDFGALVVDCWSRVGSIFKFLLIPMTIPMGFNENS